MTSTINCQKTFTKSVARITGTSPPTQSAYQLKKQPESSIANRKIKTLLKINTRVIDQNKSVGVYIVYVTVLKMTVNDASILFTPTYISTKK
ncbi:MAG: hypothetical protein B0W54_03105 [Cellvibrio sp. 79]|nr:MAG: hypothetical protein B0W54_03105 [Cellvibrio sp. 79]